jgi:NitT/TauT family transport system permease protein
LRVAGRLRAVGRLRAAGPPAVVFGLAVAGWYGVSHLVLAPRRRFLLPPPDEVIRIGFLDPDNRAELLAALAVSARVALAGLAVATVAGVAVAVLMSQARWLERSLYPYAVVLQTVPVLAMVPLFGYWFGFGLTARVLVCALIALFPIIAGTLFGLRSADRGHHDLFTLHGAGRLARLTKLQLPAALPAIVTGLRVSAGLSVVGAVVGDFFFRRGDRGIGILIDVYRVQFQPERMFAAVILASLLGLTVFWLFGWFGRRVTAWHESAQEPPVRSAPSRNHLPEGARVP